MQDSTYLVLIYWKYSPSVWSGMFGWQSNLSSVLILKSKLLVQHMKNVMKDMKGQPWSLSSSWWGFWGRGIAHGPTGKQFTVVIVTKIKMMSFIVLIKCLNGEQIFSSPSYKAPTLALSIILERKFFLRKMEQIIFIIGTWFGTQYWMNEIKNQYASKSHVVTYINWKRQSSKAI